MDELISRLDHTLKVSPQKPLAVFDIDSTIFNVSPRNQVILEAVMREKWLLNALTQESIDQLHSTSLKMNDWGLFPLYKKIATQELPEDLLIQVREFWKTRFFTNEYLKYDEPYEYCIPFIQSLEKRGFQIMYLTGRDNERMRKGTLEQLKQWKLPLETDKALITKPHKSMVDGPYKRGEIQQLLTPDKHLWFFDNEPSVLSHCDFTEEHYQLIFIDSVHSNRSKPLKSWTTITPQDYRKLFEGVQK